jgi:ferrous iron transport protein A
MRIRLSDLKAGETAIIEELALPESERQLLVRFGFFDGAEVRCSRRTPMGDPVVYSVDATEVALRTETACRIFASPVDKKTCEQTG